MVAARRLQSLIDSRDYSRDIAELRFQVGQISEAVRSVVPQSMWAAIVEQLEQQSEALNVGEDGFDDDDTYDPIEFIEEDDEF